MAKIKIPTVEEMLEAGVHFGHQVKRRSPFMDKYVYGTDNKSHIIDVYKTQEMLEKAANYLYETAKSGKQIILVGTKRQAAPVVKEAAEKSGSMYVNQRWLGGTFTNFESVKSKVDRLKKLTEGRLKNAFDKYTKKERLMIDRDIEKLELVVGGIKDIKKYPEALVIVDIKKEHVAVDEAKKSKVKVVAIVDTNSDPRDVDYIIPANDDAIKSISLIVNTLADAISQGYKDYVPPKEGK